MRQLFYYKVYYKRRQVIILQNATFCNKILHLVQNASILLQNATVITKYDVYYKLQQYILSLTGIGKNLCLKVCVLNEYLSSMFYR